MDVQINIWGVLAAVIVSMAVGMVWYARGVFGNAWIKLAKVKMDRDESVVRPIVISLAVSLITAYTLAYTAYIANSFFGNSFLYDSILTAFWLWLGLTAARIITHDVFEGRPARLTAITLGNEFVTTMMMGLVIGLVGV